MTRTAENAKDWLFSGASATFAVLFGFDGESFVFGLPAKVSFINLNDSLKEWRDVFGHHRSCDKQRSKDPRFG